ncbi:MAG TPA: sulfotransferase [Tepidisphaeraceae bacterium]
MKHEVSLGDAFYAGGHFAEARRCYERALLAEPASGAIHFKLATCYWGEGNRDGAHRALQAAAGLEPRLACAHEWLGQWYLQEGMGEAAMRHSSAAMKLAPGDAGTIASHVFVLEAAGELKTAWGLLNKLLLAGYTPARVAMLYGRLAPRNGRCDEALKLVKKLLREGGTPRDRTSLHFVATDLLDRMGRYAEAFEHADRANALSRSAWDPLRHARDVDQLINYFTAQRMRTLARATYLSEQPVFIVGMPRSGTSLVEQIIASHPEAYGAGELDFVQRIRLGAIRMAGATEEAFPQCLDRLSVDQLNGLAQVYLGPLKAMASQAVRITDKMPLNFMHLGLIAMLFPQARIIHCSRHPMDTCLSCYMTHFTAGHPFTTDLHHLAAFYQAYRRLMNHWREALPLPIMDLSYEKLVTDPTRQVAQVMEFVGLPWNPMCLRFYETRRFVTTASVEQVRLPVYTSSVGRWRNYKRQLLPLETTIPQN